VTNVADWFGSRGLAIDVEDVFGDLAALATGHAFR
jgi:hypothetical protein